MNTDRLDEFLGALRRAGWSLGVDAELRVRELLVVLAARGEDVDDPARVQRFLRPLLCSSPEQQEAFPRLWTKWLAEAAPASEPLPPSAPVRQLEPLAASSKGFATEIARLARDAQTAWLLGGLVVLLVGAGFWTWGRWAERQARETQIAEPAGEPIVLQPAGAQDAAVPVEPTPEPALGLDWPLALAGGALALVLAWRASSERFLRRRPDSGPVRLDRLRVAVPDRAALAGWDVRAVARRLRPVRTVVSGISVPRTVAGAVRSFGWLDPAPDERPVRVEHLALIDRAAAADHLAALAEAALRGLSDEGVYVDAWSLEGALARRGSERATLADLGSRYPERPLWYWGTADSLLSGTTGGVSARGRALGAWTDRVLVTPEPAEGWGAAHAVLREAGWRVVEARPRGLGRLHERGLADEGPSQGTAPVLPARLRDAPRRWTAPTEPPPDEVAGLLDDLALYLGADGVRWLAACAVYPELRWELTLVLGRALRDVDGHPLLTEARLAALARLPWLRAGYLPDWLRLRLLQALPARDARDVRATLRQLLLSSLDGPVDGLELEIAGEDRPFLAFLWRVVAQRERRAADPDSPFQDRVFVDFLGGGLAFRLPALLRERLSSAVALPPPSAGLNAVVGLLAGAGLAAWVGPWAAGVAALGALTVRVLGAPGGFAGRAWTAIAEAMVWGAGIGIGLGWMEDWYLVGPAVLVVASLETLGRWRSGSLRRRVFISYGEGLLEGARAVRDTLVRDDQEVLSDSWEEPAGRGSLEESVARGIRSADVVVVLVGPDGPAAWMRSEIAISRQLGKPLLGFVVGTPGRRLGLVPEHDLAALTTVDEPADLPRCVRDAVGAYVPPGSRPLVPGAAGWTADALLVRVTGAADALARPWAPPDGGLAFLGAVLTGAGGAVATAAAGEKSGFYVILTALAGILLVLRHAGRPATGSAERIALGFLVGLGVSTFFAAGGRWTHFALTYLLTLGGLVAAWPTAGEPSRAVLLGAWVDRFLPDRLLADMAAPYPGEPATVEVPTGWGRALARVAAGAVCGVQACWPALLDAAASDVSNAAWALLVVHGLTLVPTLGLAWNGRGGLGYVQARVPFVLGTSWAWWIVATKVSAGGLPWLLFVALAVELVGLVGAVAPARPSAVALARFAVRWSPDALLVPPRPEVVPTAARPGAEAPRGLVLLWWAAIGAGLGSIQATPDGAVLAPPQVFVVTALGALLSGVPHLRVRVPWAPLAEGGAFAVAFGSATGARSVLSFAVVVVLVLSLWATATRPLAAFSRHLRLRGPPPWLPPVTRFLDAISPPAFVSRLLDRGPVWTLVLLGPMSFYAAAAASAGTTLPVGTTPLVLKTVLAVLLAYTCVMLEVRRRTTGTWRALVGAAVSSSIVVGASVPLVALQAWQTVLARPAPASITFDGPAIVTVHTLDPVPVTKARVLDADGVPFDVQPVLDWTVTPPEVARFEGVNVVPLAPGTATITASVGEVRTSYRLVVAPADRLDVLADGQRPLVVRRDVSAPTSSWTFRFGDRVVVNAAASVGSEEVVAEVTFTSSDADVLLVEEVAPSASGGGTVEARLYAVRPGYARLTVSAAGLTAQIRVFVKK